jgi:transketolase
MIPEEWLDTYGLDDSHLPMSSMPKYTPGIEISGGSIGL